VILDACFLVDLLDGEDRAVAKLDEIEDELLSVPTLLYTEVGVGIDPETEVGRQFEAVIGRVRLVPYDAEAAKRAVDVQRQLRRDGETVGAVDAMVAGTALARDERVVTRNVSEFHGTPARVSPY
jgi:tRNA(fMet)-specific endonuclease VapC